MKDPKRKFSLEESWNKITREKLMEHKIFKKGNKVSRNKDRRIKSSLEKTAIA